MIDKLKKNSRYFIVLVLAVMIGSVMFEKCISAENIIESADINQMRRHIIDSIAVEQHAKRIALIDSLEKARQEEIKAIKSKNTGLLKENNKLKTQIDSIYAVADTLDLANCNKVVDFQSELIENQDTIIENQYKEIDVYRISLYSMNQKYIAEQSEKMRVRWMYDECTSDNVNLSKALKKHESWWAKNDKWVFGGLGILAGIIIAK